MNGATRGRRWSVAILAAAACLSGASLLAAWSNQTGAPRPTTVAIVDVMAVTDGLAEAKALQLALQAKKTGFEKQLKDAKAREQALDADLKAMAADNPARKDKEMEYFRARVSNEAEFRMLQELVLEEGGEIRRKLYRKIIDEVAAMAPRSGYDLVLLDDRKIPLPSSSDGERGVVDDARVVSTILQKKIIYANEAMDITQLVIAAMNNNFKR